MMGFSGGYWRNEVQNEEAREKTVYRNWNLLSRKEDRDGFGYIL